MDRNAWTRYLRKVTQPDNDRTIAQKLGVSPSTIGRWVSGEIDPKPRQVVSLARAYGEHPLTALIAAGYLDPNDLGDGITIKTRHDLDDVSTFELLEEVQSRVEGMGEYLAWIEQIGGGRIAHGSLGQDVLRYITPSQAPADANSQVYLDAIGSALEAEDVNGTLTYRPKRDVGGERDDTESRNQDDYDLVAHPYTEETGELMDE